MKCCNSLFERQWGLYSRFQKTAEVQIAGDRNPNQTSLSREFAFLGLHGPSSGRARWKCRQDAPPGTSQLRFFPGGPQYSQAGLAQESGRAGELCFEKAWKKNPKQAARVAARGRVPRGFYTPLPQDLMSTRAALQNLGSSGSPALSVWWMSAREGSKGTLGNVDRWKLGNSLQVPFIFLQPDIFYQNWRVTDTH